LSEKQFFSTSSLVSKRCVWRDTALSVVVFVLLAIFDFYILSQNKDVHNYKRQFTHKEIYGRVNIYIQMTIKTIKYKCAEISNHHMFRAFKKKNHGDKF
jgi:hypothetical protein